MPDDPVSKSDFQRLERKVDQLHDDYRAIILTQERQAEQGKRIGELEQRMKSDEDVTKKVSEELKSWINRGIGVWIAAIAVWTITNSAAFLSLFKVKG